MNILHHKKWNVYNKDNVERVKKDEAAAERAEKDKEAKRMNAEKEKTLQALRSRAKEKYGDLVEEEKLEHVNLFKQEELEAQKNVEHEIQTKKEREDWERKNTIWHLDSVKGKDAWYKRPRHEESSPDRKDKLRKIAENPLSKMKASKQVEKKPASKPVASSGGKSKIEQLREERLKREREERERLTGRRA